MMDSSPGAESQIPATSKAKRRKAPPKRRKSRKLKTRVQCKQCDKTFGRKDALLEHCKEKHNANPRRYQCPSCPKTFLRKYNWTVHIRSVHSGERPFACEHCPDKFTQQAHRARHVEKCHVCELCQSAYSDLGAHREKVHGHICKKTVGSTRTLKCVCGARVKNLHTHQQSCNVFHSAQEHRLANVPVPRQSTLHARVPSPYPMLSLHNEVPQTGELSTAAMNESREFPKRKRWRIGELPTSTVPEVAVLSISAMPEIERFSISAMREVGEFPISTLPEIGNITAPMVTEIGELPTPTNSFEGIVDIDSGANAHVADLDNFRRDLDGFNRSLTNAFLPAVLQASQWTTFLKLSMTQCSTLPFRTSLIFDLSQNVQLEMSTSGDVDLSRGGPPVSRFNGMFNRFLRRRSDNVLIDSGEFAMSMRGDEDYDSDHPMSTCPQLIEDIMAPNAINNARVNDDAANGFKLPKLQILRLSWSEPSARNSCDQELWAGFGAASPLDEAIRGFPDPEVHEEVNIESAYLHGLFDQTLALNSSVLKNASLNRLQKCVFFRTGVLVSELLTNLPSLTELVCVACVNAFDESKLHGVKSWHFFDGRQARTLILDHNERVGRATRVVKIPESARLQRHLPEHDKASDGPNEAVESSMEGCGASRVTTISISKLAVWSRTPIRENETAQYTEMSNSDSTKPTAAAHEFHRAGERIVDATSLYMPIERAKTKQERNCTTMPVIYIPKEKLAEWRKQVLLGNTSTLLKCPVCSRAFSGKHNLYRHMVEIHPANPPKFPCHQCSKTFKRKSTLLYHRSYHRRSSARNVSSVLRPKKQRTRISRPPILVASRQGGIALNLGDT